MNMSGDGNLIVPGVIAVLTIAAFVWLVLPGSQEPLPEPPARSSLPNLPRRVRTTRRRRMPRQSAPPAFLAAASVTPSTQPGTATKPLCVA